jgi:hypothetical protein
MTPMAVAALWVTVPAYDPSQRLTGEWVEALFPRLDELCVVTHEDHDGIEAWRCLVPADVRDQVAWRVAVGLAARRLALVPDLFFDWFGAATGCVETPVPADRLQMMQVRGLLVDVGTPQAPAGDIQFFGLLAESVLHEILWGVDRGLGRPVVVEGHDWSTLDHGGDKLAIYLIGGERAFRLWESKALSSMSRTATEVVSDAVEQLEVRAAGYLARFAVTASRAMDDQELADFAAQLPELWANKDPRGGFGVSVTTHDVPVAQACFAQLVAHFDIPNGNKSGQLALLGPLEPFRDRVREVLWKGVGLWIEP